MFTVTRLYFKCFLINSMGAISLVSTPELSTNDIIIDLNQDYPLQ